jgi:tripartite-type tricarboxylate transporter receptor subunit TctC
MMVIGTGAAWGQGYPDRPIRVITPQAGGATDLSTRMISDAAIASLGQRMIVENRGIVGVEIVAKWTADGGAGSTRPDAWMRPGSGL